MAGAAAPPRTPAQRAFWQRVIEQRKATRAKTIKLLQARKDHLERARALAAAEAAKAKRDAEEAKRLAAEALLDEQTQAFRRQLEADRAAHAAQQEANRPPDLAAIIEQSYQGDDNE